MTQFNSNFASFQNLTRTGVTLTGDTIPPRDAELLFRAAVLRQDEVVAEGRGAGDKGWEVELEGAFVVGDAVALGTETYVLTNDVNQTQAFTTFTWAQTVTLQNP